MHLTACLVLGLGGACGDPPGWLPAAPAGGAAPPPVVERTGCHFQSTGCQTDAGPHGNMRRLIRRWVLGACPLRSRSTHPAILDGGKELRRKIVGRRRSQQEEAVQLCCHRRQHATFTQVPQQRCVCCVHLWGCQSSMTGMPASDPSHGCPCGVRKDASASTGKFSFRVWLPASPAAAEAGAHSSAAARGLMGRPVRTRLHSRPPPPQNLHLAARRSCLQFYKFRIPNCRPDLDITVNVIACSRHKESNMPFGGRPHTCC